ncbi:GGDEF domain-containing protein [uncultured Methylobacterium sp.]|uniref:GGDEF domain-containing protein n=1 Tax=uncultured Methylobacterium sp. TaxID=157278 RepID=UPI00261C9E23|nr:GGDEF domain-containing protein [uncultured Methylobacterium sp.]
MRWLTETGVDLPIPVKATLLSGLLTAVVPLILGAIANLMITIVAAIRHPDPVFLWLLGLDVALFGLRLWLLRRIRRALARNAPTPTDLLLASSIAWATIVGVGTALCFLTGDPVLQVLAPLSMMGLLSGVATRNNGAPRFAVLQIALCDLPLKGVMLFSGEPWLMLGVVQAALFMAAMVGTVFRLNRGYLAVIVAERASERRATHDDLTGLRNRTGLLNALALGVERRTRTGEALALLYLDLDGFKAVNDGFGHAVGDALLRDVSVRIAAALPEGCVAARLGGDEFVVLATGPHACHAAEIGHGVIAALSRPYDLGGGRVGLVGASVGVAWAVADATPDSLLAEADAALYEAKAFGKGRCVLSSRSAQESLPPASPRAAEAAPSASRSSAA